MDSWERQINLFKLVSTKNTPNICFGQSWLRVHFFATSNKFYYSKKFYLNKNSTFLYLHLTKEQPTTCAIPNIFIQYIEISRYTYVCYCWTLPQRGKMVLTVYIYNYLCITADAIRWTFDSYTTLHVTICINEKCHICIERFAQLVYE